MAASEASPASVMGEAALARKLSMSSHIALQIAELVAELIKEQDKDKTQEEKAKRFKEVLMNKKNVIGLSLLGYGQASTTKAGLALLGDYKLKPEYFRLEGDILKLSKAGLDKISELPENSKPYTACPARHVRTSSDYSNFLEQRAEWELGVYAHLWDPFPTNE